MEQHIIDGIDLERAYQDKKWGTVQEHPHTLMEWVTIMRAELNEVEEAWLKTTDEHTLLEILQVIATGVACLEQHGVYVREGAAGMRELVEPKIILRSKLHSHPRLEHDLKVPADHVIIDKEVFYELMTALGRPVLPDPRLVNIQ